MAEFMRYGETLPLLRLLRIDAYDGHAGLARQKAGRFPKISILHFDTRLFGYSFDRHRWSIYRMLEQKRVHRALD
ncbi:hypothetical protein [Rhizobium sp. 007]|uniref:hypothetical protein n=1 Tax=Rhizobium sp. 007 TaxID=2785056 RepID=UPI001FF02A38|nr:hypothetical protein [Rhizobium sp. 007]